MIVSIPMPGRKNAKGVDLSVSATELNVEGVPGFEPLHVQLPVRSFPPALSSTNCSSRRCMSSS
jgi:hypothetical protein